LGKVSDDLGIDDEVEYAQMSDGEHEFMMVTLWQDIESLNADAGD